MKEEFDPYLRSRTVAFTGRRTYRGEADGELRELLHLLYARGMRRFLCGMAWGFDLAAGAEVARLKRRNEDVVLVAVEPYANFRDRFRGEDAKAYDELLAVADERVVVGEEDAAAYMRRNDFLVQQAQVVVAWWDNLPHGGTAYTVKRARRCGREVVNLYPEPQLELQF